MFFIDARLLFEEDTSPGERGSSNKKGTEVSIDII
jgi:hypothetical protein